MNNRGDVLALAMALSAGEEVTLGPTDSALCAAALTFMANEQRKAGWLKAMRVPVLLTAAALGTVALGGSSIGNTNTQVSMMELADVPVAHFETVVRRHIKALPHSSPESLKAQRIASSFPLGDS
ncbi:hypothetical protein ACKWRH_26555 [Bradyrhizobium sp. Pa8]|uniref:hypothetical protein n=1 Tax=Bradyrhizobium sp. Pa8 TaxID=3386552 RepID=UPI00403F79F1